MPRIGLISVYKVPEPIYHRGYLDVHGRRPGTRQTEEQLIIESLLSDTSNCGVQCGAKTTPSLPAKTSIRDIRDIRNIRKMRKIRIIRITQYAIRNTHTQTPVERWATFLHF